MLPVASLRPVQNRPSQTGRPLGLPLLMAFGFCNPSGILLCCKPCSLCCVQFVPLCQQHQLQTELLAELPTDFSISTSISCFRSSASFALVDLASLPRSSSVLCCCSSRNRFFNSAAFYSSLQSPLQSQIGVLLLSRRPSISALLQCVDDFQYPRLSSSVQLLSSRHCSPRTFQPAVGHALQSSSPIGNLPLPLSLTPFRHWLFWLWFVLSSLSSGVASPSTTLWQLTAPRFASSTSNATIQHCATS